MDYKWAVQHQIFHGRGKLVWMEEGGEEGGQAISGLSPRCTHQHHVPALGEPPPPTQLTHQQRGPALKIPRPHDAGQQVVADAGRHLHHIRERRVTRGHNLPHR